MQTRTKTHTHQLLLRYFIMHLIVKFPNVSWLWLSASPLIGIVMVTRTGIVYTIVIVIEIVIVAKIVIVT